MPQNPFVRVIAIVALSLSLAAGIFLWWQTQKQGPGTTAKVSSSGTALIGGPFQLTDQNGDARSEGDLLGSYSLIYFGYTYCPDICPATLSLMTQAIDRLEESSKEKADRIRPVFFTVDPERDTVDSLREYAAHFHPRLMALTGSVDKVREAAKVYRIFYKKVDDDGSSEYLMDHTSLIYLMAPDGAYLTHFPHVSDAAAIAEKLSEYVKGG